MTRTPRRSSLPRRLPELLRRLKSATPRGRAMLAAKSAFEHLLLGRVKKQGFRGADRIVADLNARGYRFGLIEKHKWYRRWRDETPDERGALEIASAVNPFYRSASVSYRPIVRMTPRQQKIHAVQQAFYARYMAVGQRAYRAPRARLSADDRLVLLVGELEADVNNGGFAQYLDNKGRRRARAALAALTTIGAGKTARMLEQAMAPGVTEAELSKLDDQFSKVPEDLAVFTARHVGLTG